MIAKMLAAYVQRKQGEMIACIKKMGIFVHLPLFQKCWKMAKGYLGHGVKWERVGLTAEMLEFIHMGVHNIICAQPFGCLPIIS